MSNELAVIAPQNLNEVKEMSLSLSKASVVAASFRRRFVATLPT